MRCALPCTPGCRTEYAVSRSDTTFTSKGAYPPMKNTGILRIQAFACPSVLAHRGCVSSPCHGNGFTAAAVSPTRPAPLPTFPLKPPPVRCPCRRTTPSDPMPLSDLTAAKAGFRTVRIQGVQIFAGQVTLAQPEMIPETEEDRRRGKPAHSHPGAFTVHRRWRQRRTDPMENCVPRVLDRVIIPKNITVHLGKPAASARNVTVSFRDYIANVASSEVYPTWADENNPTGPLNCSTP